MNDDNLIDRLRAGDRMAIRQLVDDFQPAILRTARGFVRNDEDARDIAQEVLIDVITKIDHFRGKSSISTWIYRITVNRSLNHLRTLKRKPAYQQRDHSGEISGDSTGLIQDQTGKDPSEILERKERSRILHNALDQLPDKQRIAITLAEFDEQPYQQIAEIMQLSIPAVESLIFRARRNLQKKLWKYFNQ